VKMLVLKTPLPKKNITQPDANMYYVTEEYWENSKVVNIYLKKRVTISITLKC
jgi:hypothetical protein